MNQISNRSDVHASVCPLDCADTCSLSIELEDGKVSRVRGSRSNPFTRGKICTKVAQGLAEQVHGPKRLTQPLLLDGPKGGGNYRPISWEQALDLIYQRFSEIMDRWGAQAIAPLTYGGPMGLLANGSMDARFFHRLGSSEVDSSPLCAGVSGEAWERVYGDVGGIAYTELAQSKLIVVWGNNVTACNLHLTTIIRDARKRGAKLVVVDPKRTRIAREADLHLAVMPGTDVVLAYAVAAQLAANGGLDADFIAEHVHGADAFLQEAAAYPLARAAELCGVAEADIEQFACWWRDLAPAAISLGVAPERNRNGGSSVRAVLALPALTGNIGPMGAGVCDVSGFFPVDSDALSRPDLRAQPVREFNVLDLPRHIMDPGAELPIKGVFIYNHNPVAVHPRQREMRAALLSDDVFVVGSDVSMTDSMACADLILPATTHLEYGDLYKAYGHQYLQRSAPVIEPVGEAVSNTELFRRLATRFGFTEPCFADTDAALMDQAIEAGVPALQDRSPSDLPPNEAINMDDGRPTSLLRGTAPATPSGKIELFSDALQAEEGHGVPQYQALMGQRPFLVVSPASEHRINSTFGGVAGHDRDVVCEMAPADALSLGLEAGCEVILSNEQGEVQLPLVVSDNIRTGTVFVPKGAWIGDSPTGQTINALIPGHKADLAGGACYYDCSVDIRAVG
ncbi:oxidoreductase [Halioglobus sp. HI00S01]|uniref:molybdopterin-dependent oxidoreductase n=1 Tax=Halioglobus sp. HI00S01 TaxID=1822214 RepID=UPI0007C22499|nr:molybdopterin-dependent oxidoreductase [Halioglobus sp. HI00S01]KZX59306.1 oxidoreductase [Halioglobus sp. HI00S01]